MELFIIFFKLLYHKTWCLAHYVRRTITWVNLSHKLAECHTAIWHCEGNFNIYLTQFYVPRLIRTDHVATRSRPYLQTQADHACDHRPTMLATKSRAHLRPQTNHTCNHRPTTLATKSRQHLRPQADHVCDHKQPTLANHRSTPLATTGRSRLGPRTKMTWTHAACAGLGTSML